MTAIAKALYFDWMDVIKMLPEYKVFESVYGKAEAVDCINTECIDELLDSLINMAVVATELIAKARAIVSDMNIVFRLSQELNGKINAVKQRILDMITNLRSLNRECEKYT